VIIAEVRKYSRCVINISVTSLDRAEMPMYRAFEAGEVDPGNLT
jgi:hypothetical protein